MCKYIMACGLLIFLYVLLGYYYFTKYKTDKPSYATVKKYQIICFTLTIMNYILMISSYFSPAELVEYYKENYFYITLIYIISLLISF